MGSIGFNTSGQLQINGIQRSFDVSTPYHLLSGNLSLTNSIITSGFATTLYTGNGSTQSVNTGVDMDTQWGNLATEKFGGLVWGKNRATAYGHKIFDTIRGATVAIDSSGTAGNVTYATGLTAFTSSGFTTGALVDTNANTQNIASWVFQTTHRITGTTNHNQPYECHYNPFTGFTMIKYTGSGIAGHEIPHHLGRKLGLGHIKNLTTAGTNWATFIDDTTKRLLLNTTNAQLSDGNGYWTDNNVASVVLAAGAGINEVNATSNTYILYGWANSYFDEANTLTGNYEIGTYQGTGAVGNKVTTKGKPAWVMVKRLDATENWYILDGQRNNFDNNLIANLSNAEATFDFIDINPDGFTQKSTNAGSNASGGQYLYMVVYDNDSGSGKSKYPRATDTSALNLNATVPFANGVDSNGTKNSILVKNETVSGLTLTEGKNYIYAKNDGTYGVKSVVPQYGSYNGFGDYFDLNSNKWYSSPSVFSDLCDSTVNWIADEVNGSTVSTISSVNGELKIVNSGATYGAARTTINTVSGRKYRLYFTFNAISANGIGVYVGSTIRGLDIATYSTTTPSTYKLDFVASSTTTHLMIYNNNASGNISTWDNIAVYPINNDGSVDTSSATAITESRNYLDAVVYADQNGQPAYIEQLPKTQYVDDLRVTRVVSDDVRSKNSCTAWVTFDGTTTPPTIRDAYNVKAVVRTATGGFDIYFNTPMDNTNYSLSHTVYASSAGNNDGINSMTKSTNKVHVDIATIATVLVNPDYADIQIFGGKH